MHFVTLRCGILTLKTSDSFFRSFRFLRQNEAFSATEQNQTYNNSFFFRRLNTIQKKVSFCWIAFRFLRKRDCPEVYNFYSNEKLQKKCVNPLDFNFPESHILLVHSTLPNCRFRIARKKKKIIHPRCGFGACLRCERAF